MSKRHLILVKLDAINGECSSSNFASILALSLDWIELSSGMWLVYTSSSSKKWVERFRRKIGVYDRIFVIEVNPDDRAGRWASDVWEFIKDKQKKMAS